MSDPTPNLPTTTSSAPHSPESIRRKPRVSLAIATAFGLGYLPKAPGTWGSAAGLLLSWGFLKLWQHIILLEGRPIRAISVSYALPAILVIVLVGLVGLWAANRTATYLKIKDPQVVVVDEVSGQMIATLFTVGGTERYIGGMSGFHYGFWWFGDPNWKYLLLGFILFRVFDIWKPFPARQAESLPGGLGIMADDWIAGIYAALGLWIARALGL
jgi:phosphatidylglycerophosphatase A